MPAHTDNAIEINAPRDWVWEHMMNVEDWPNLYSEYAKAEILEREGDRIVFRLTTHPDPEWNGQVWSWTSERVADPSTYTSKSKRIETGPFQYMNISWSFEDTGGGTLMRWVQDFSMKPEAPVSDEQAQENMNKSTREQMRVVKERLEARAAAERGGS
jgi:aromatase